MKTDLGTDYSRSFTPDSYSRENTNQSYVTRSRSTRYSTIKNNQSRYSWSPSLRSDVDDTDLTARNYHSSSFPSLLTQLGSKQICKEKMPKASNKAWCVDNKPSEQRKSQKKNTEMYYAENMKKRNEALWLRIQAVAEEKLALYDQYAKQMLIKVKRQRERINRRSQELLEILARQEVKKKDDRFYDSSHGRIWRHHRTMQRRALSLEPMRKKDNSVFPI